MSYDQIEFPVTLTLPELATLLNLIDADKLIGVDDELLFPKSKGERGRLWEEGRRQLEDHGWLTPGVKGETYSLNANLMQLVASMADPETVVITNCRAADNRWTGMVHYLATGLVVEQTQHDDTFRLNALATPDVMIARLVNILELPNVEAQLQPCELPIAAIRQLRDLCRFETLLELGIAPSQCESLCRVLTSGQKTGTIIFLAASGGKVIRAISMAIVSVQGSHPWIVTSMREGVLCYRYGGVAEFTAVAREILDELVAVPNLQADQ